MATVNGIHISPLDLNQINGWLNNKKSDFIPKKAATFEFVDLEEWATETGNEPKQLLDKTLIGIGFFGGLRVKEN